MNAESLPTVLLAEDDPQIRRLVLKLLTKNGFEVLEATDGRNAIEQVERAGATIDLLVTDVVMPLMNGAELANELQRRDPNLKVLFMSGFPDNAAVRDVLSHTDNFLPKPFAPSILLAKVRQTLAGCAKVAMA